MKYKSVRARAWRNALVAAINAGLEQKKFSLDPSEPEHASEGVYEFTIADIPAIAAFREIGWEELRINVALWPKENAGYWLDATGIRGSLVGEVFAAGWLERRNGKWLQDGKWHNVYLRRERISEVVEIEVEPLGYADAGRFFP